MYKKNLYKIRIGSKPSDILEQFTTLEKAQEVLPTYLKCFNNAYYVARSQFCHNGQVYN